MLVQIYHRDTPGMGRHWLTLHLTSKCSLSRKPAILHKLNSLSCPQMCLLECGLLIPCSGLVWDLLVHAVCTRVALRGQPSRASALSTLREACSFDSRASLCLHLLIGMLWLQMCTASSGFCMWVPGIRNSGPYIWVASTSTTESSL